MQGGYEAAGAPPLPVSPTAWLESETRILAPGQSGAESSEARLEFTGNGVDFFAIWIVNLLLTVITLGLYIPWARVRTRRYLYAHTRLMGDSFDYFAEPTQLLWGYLIIVGFVATYTLASMIDPLLAIPFMLVLFGAVPWLFWKSLRFFASHSAFRNVRLRFLGDLGNSYMINLVMPILTSLSLGLLGPLWARDYRRYFFDNMGFGTFRSRFEGSIRYFYAVYLCAYGSIILLGSALFALAMMVGFAASFAAAPGEAEAQAASLIASLLVGVGVLAFNVAMFIVAAVVGALITNHTWNETSIIDPERPEAAPIRFRSKIEVLPYLWILFSNAVLIILTLGLFTPFATIRALRYRLGCLTVLNANQLSAALAEAHSTDGALGDSASEAFEFEIGL